jgi:hypothetical protein
VLKNIKSTTPALGFSAPQDAAAAGGKHYVALHSDQPNPAADLKSAFTTCAGAVQHLKMMNYRYQLFFWLAKLVDGKSRYQQQQPLRTNTLYTPLRAM